MNAVKFDRAVFEIAFVAAIAALTQSEAVTKKELKELSRSVLTAVHETGDIGYVNRLVNVLTPVNKKVARLFFKHFTGFSFDEVSLLFTKKSKKRYDGAFKHYVEFMADPNNNIWTWAEREINVEQKPYTEDILAKYLKGVMANRGMTQMQVLRATIAAGVTVESIIALMDEVGYDVKVGEEQPAPQE